MEFTKALSIQTYKGAKRVKYLLESLDKYGWVPFPVYVFEDPSSKEHEEELKEVCNNYNVRLGKRPTWGNMQGCFQFAMEQTTEELMILMSDDILVQPGWYEEHLSWWDKVGSIVGASAFSHWDSSELIEKGIIKDRYEFYSKLPNSFTTIANNCASCYTEPDIIHAVHGSCFALRRDVWKNQGGFAQDFLAQDEDISRKIWVNTDLICARFPGEPLLHLAGAAQASDEHPEVHLDICSYQGMPKGLSPDEIWQLQIPKREVGRKLLNKKLKGVDVNG